MPNDPLRDPAPSSSHEPADPSTTPERPVQRRREREPSTRSAKATAATKLFVLDTNVLMHDPTSLFRFEEHDVFLPMVVLEELDDHKKGMSEVSRNARQASRFLDEIFQYPRGKGAAGGLVRHEPNHADHFHVRFRCAKADADCS